MATSGSSTSPDSGWDGLAEWWIQEVAADPAYEEVVTPLVVQLLEPTPRELVLHVGCGEGRVMRAVADRGGRPIGVDIDRRLLEIAGAVAPVARMNIPPLGFAADSFDAAVVSLVLEHITAHRQLLDEVARVLRPFGCLVVVANHPMFTAPDSAPIYDGDGEMLWRPGRYFDPGYTEEPAGGGTIRFHHRTMAELLNAAADAGLALERIVELGPSKHQIARTPALADQAHIPRLLGVRWRSTRGH